MSGITYDDKGYGIPVLTYEELAGLMLGYNPWDIGLQVHQVDVVTLLNKMEYPYNIKEKYQGLNGKDLGKPQGTSLLTCC